MAARLTVLLVVAVLITTAHTAAAADRALLIGVGDYSLPGASLPGIDRDLETMREIALSMGFEDKNIRILKDGQATLSGIRIAFQRHLIHGVKPEDRVLLYYTGHGTQVPDASGDESDGADETLMPFNVELRTRRGVTTLENVLLDDELDTLLSAIPSEQILVFVDACHSGTVTRMIPNLADPEAPNYVSKSYVWEGMPEPEETFVRDLEINTFDFNYIGLSAAADNELAIATERGSVFTNALAETLAESAIGESLTMTEVAERVSEKIKNSVDPERVFTPQISGNKKNADKILLGTSPANR